MYTKGEWSVVGQPNAYMVQARIPNKIHNLKLIADCFNNKEDAHLIASAPDLYEACEEFMKSRSMYDPAYQTIIKALAKADGK